MAALSKSGTEIQENSERVFALDALRAIMMLLGIVIHASITYGAIDYQTAWPLKEANTSPLFDILVAFIHTFRMPVFFVASGYFGALLFYKKGPKALLVNRFKRIFLPFAVGVLIIWPLIVVSFIFSQSAFSNSSLAFSSLIDVLITGKFLPFNIAHLWFLYFLMMFALLGWFLGLLFQKEANITTFVNNLFTKIFQTFWLRLIVMSVAFFFCLYWMGTSFLLTNNQWSIDPSIFVTYFVFFGTGWMLYKTNCLLNLKQYPIFQLSVATLLFLANIFMPWPSESWVSIARQALNAVYSSFFIFGFISFFLTYFNTYSPRLRYIMDSAYWVYIVHLPIVAFIPGLVTGFELPVIIKFAITFSSTLVICFVSYRYLVRGSFIGLFLNGKVYKKNSLTPITT